MGGASAPVSPFAEHLVGDCVRPVNGDHVESDFAARLHRPFGLSDLMYDAYFHTTRVPNAGPLVWTARVGLLP